MVLFSGDEDDEDSSPADQLKEFWLDPFLEQCESMQTFLGPKAALLRKIIIQSIKLGDKL